ncbi:DNA mismatch repair protein MSH6 [Tanacetum coccineum]
MNVLVVLFAVINEAFGIPGRVTALLCKVRATRFSDLTKKPCMILDAAALENLEVFENSVNGDSKGTLYYQLNRCVTAFGKGLLKSWLSRPLYDVDSIRELQEAVAGVKGVNLPHTLGFRKELAMLPYIERLLARVFSCSEANGRNASKVILYEDASKKQFQEFILVLSGCELIIKACSLLGKKVGAYNPSGWRQLVSIATGVYLCCTLNEFMKIFKCLLLLSWSTPNMGGKSTLLRQVCLAVILAQVGADAPAESFKMSPVDRIFVRMGAKDHIMAGERTFLTELLETASTLIALALSTVEGYPGYGVKQGENVSQKNGKACLSQFVQVVNEVYC